MTDKDKKKEEEIEGKGFTVKDKRRFTEEAGEIKAKPDAKAPDQEKPAEPAPREQEPAPAQEEQDGQEPLPEINFVNFVLSLSTSAMVHLGDVPDPFSNQPNQNLPMAKQTIDILGMLADKTKGNLEKDEEAMLTNALYQLRMRYVMLSKQQPAPTGEGGEGTDTKE